MIQPEKLLNFDNGQQTTLTNNQQQHQKFIHKTPIQTLQENKQRVNQVQKEIQQNKSKMQIHDSYKVQTKMQNQKLNEKTSQKYQDIYQEDLSSDQQKTNKFQFQTFKKTLSNQQNQNQLLQKPQINTEKQTKKIKLQSQQPKLQQKRKKQNTVEQQTKREMASSINPDQKVQSRKIPDKLLQSYEEIVLPKTQNKKSQKKQKQKNIKTKGQNQQQIKNSPLVDEQLLTSLPTIQGFCSIKFQNKNPLQIKYVIIKQTIVFPELKKIYIKTIKKIKILQKNDQYFIKISIQKGPKQDEVILLTVFANQNAKFAVFYRTFQFFSNIVLRKILLKSILINPHILKFQKNQPLEYESNLFKKDHFFSSWQKRKIRLENNILSTFKGEKCSNQIKSVRQLWTRFDMMNGYLVIKMWHSYEKIQLGIPLCDFTIIDAKMNWLYGLIRLIKQRQDDN